MLIKILIPLMIIHCWCRLPLFSQQLRHTLEQQLENEAEAAGLEEADDSQFEETLSYHREHPLNLNRAEAGELMALGIFDDLRIKNLLDHREKNGPLICIYELQSIDGFDVDFILQILPYILVADHTGQAVAKFGRIIHDGKHELLLRCSRTLEKQTGFAAADSAAICNAPGSRYIGSPEKIFTRYRFLHANRISAGITAEKDPGELFFKGNQKFKYPAYDSLLEGKQKSGFDFYSVHVFISKIKFIRALAAGDYQAGFGQGLVASSGLSPSQASDAVSVKKNLSGLRPHTSSDENRFMRGAGLTAGTEKFMATGFVSQKRIDARLDFDNSSKAMVISSMPADGLHATPGEIAAKHTVRETVIGGNLSFAARSFSAGITGTRTRLSAMPAGAASALLSGFSGLQASNLGFNYSLILRNLNFFGELSALSNGSFAGLTGCIAALDPRVSASVMYRHYPHSSQSREAVSFSQHSKTGNEQGIYMGVIIKPAHYITINASYDHAIFPGLKYQPDAFSESRTYFIQVNYTLNKKFETYIRFRQKDKWINTRGLPDEAFDLISSLRQSNVRWNLKYRISPSLELRNRIEMVSLRDEDGFLATQDLIWQPLRFRRFSLTGRYALFDSKSFGSRIYIYEADIPGTYSIPSYFHKGNRIYAMVHYPISRKFEIWVRWSQTYYANRSSISPGSLSEINGNKKNDVKFQVRMSF